MKRRFLILSLWLVLPLAAVESETLAQRTLRQIAERQRTLLETAAKQGDKLDEEAFRTQLQELTHGYERLLHDSPNNAEVFAAYGYLLRKVDMRKQAAAMLLKANQLDSDIPLVKNQLGNLLAEDGRPLDALPYFMAAIKLSPKEPLYHYQVGTLLHEAQDDFLKSGEWTRAALDHATHGAFKTAAELAPDRFEFGYRYAESFYDLAEPQWDEALKVWAALVSAPLLSTPPVSCAVTVTVAVPFAFAAGVKVSVPSAARAGWALKRALALFVTVKLTV